MKGYTKKEASEFIAYRSVQYYTERVIVVPEVDSGEGRGKSRRYSKKNLVEFGILNELAGHGLAFNVVKHIFGFLNLWHPDIDGYLSDGPSKKRVNGKMESGGSLLERWENLPEGTYLVLYRNKAGEFEQPEVALREHMDYVLSADRLRESASVIIVNLGTIISKVKSR